MIDGTSHAGAVHTNNSQSSKYTAPCRAGAGGKAIVVSTISRTKIIGAVLAAVACLAALGWPTEAFAQQVTLNVDSVTDDNEINLSEHTSGFDVTGNTGTESGVTVEVTIGSETLTIVTSAIAAGATDATWSVSVLGDRDYIAEGTVTLSVEATKTGFSSATVSRDLTVDLTAPTISYDTTDLSLKVGVQITSINPTTTDIDIESYAISSGSLPEGLAIDGTTGVISGTPTAANDSTQTATVTATDDVGNETETPAMIDFPLVAKGDQTLVGFGYSPSRIRDKDPAPTVIEPPGAETDVTYSAMPATVCSVDSRRGALTINAWGTCTITASVADDDDNYNAAEDATFDVGVASVVVSAERVTVREGFSESYTVVLSIEPTDIVTITLEPVGNYDPDLTATPGELTFDQSDWWIPQTVTVSAAEDADGENGIALFNHNTDSDDDDVYDGIPTNGVRVEERENDTHGVTVSPQVLRIPAGGSGIYTLKLDTEPTDPVTIDVTPDQGSDTDLTATPDQLEFDQSDWWIPQTVTVSAAVDADQVDGVATFSHSVESADTKYYELNDLPIASVTVTEDETAPTVEIQTEASAIVGGAFEVTILFSEPVEGFELEDIEVSNGRASRLKRVSSRTYTVRITPEESGELRVEVGSNVALDGVGFGNEAAAPFFIDADLTRPEVEITSEVKGPVGGAFEVTIAFSEPVEGFKLEEIRVTNGTASNFIEVSPQQYTATITPEESGELRVEVGSNVALDGLGFGNEAAAPFFIDADLTRPEVEITSEATGPVGVALEVTIAFSEAVTGFEQSEITVTNGTVSSFSGSGTSYTAEITPSASGSVTVEIAADVAEDRAGNGNRAAKPLVIEADLTGPEVEIASEATGPVGVALEVTIAFSEAVTGFEQNEITVTNGTVSSFSGSGTSYTAEITPSASGSVTVEIAADVAEDGAGNGNRAAEAFIIEADLTRPEVAIASEAGGPVSGAFEVTIAFSEAVTGFEREDIQIGNGTVADFTAVSSSAYRAAIEPTRVGQPVVVEVSEDVAEDRAGNGNEAAAPFMIETAIEVSYAAASYAATEGGDAVTVTVKLSQGWDEDLAIPIRVTRPETTEAGDYRVEGLEDWDAAGGNGTLTFQANETEQAFRVAANHDGDGDDETVALGFGELPEIVMAGEPAVAAVTLEDKGLVELTVRFEQAAYEVKEGQHGDIEVTVSPAADRRVEVPLAVSLEGGATDEDYRGVPASLVFGEGESEGTISVEVLADDVNDPGEGMVLSLGELPEAVSAGDPSTTHVSFGQRRTAEQFTRSLEGMLAVMGRSMGESAQTAIEGRFERYRQWSRLAAAGAAAATAQPGSDTGAAALSPGESQRIGSESLDGAGRSRAEGRLVQRAWGAAQTGAATGRGWNSASRETGAPGSWLQNLLLGSLGNMAGYGQSDSGISSGYGMAPGGRVTGQDRLYGSGVGNARLERGSGDFSGMRDLTLSAVSFEMPLFQQAQAQATSWAPAFWAQGNLQQFNGDLTRLGMDYRGGLNAAQAGLDLYANDRVLAGLSFMRSWGDMDYTADGIDGMLESRMNTAHPYLYLQPHDRMSVWGIGGLGRGQVDVNEPGRTHEFDADFRMFAGGVRAALSRRGSNELGLRADAFTTRLQTDAFGDLGQVGGEAYRGRLMLEWVHDRALSAGRSLSLTAEAGGRFDGGGADEGAGVETGFRLGYLDANSGLDVALHGRVLVAHASDYRDGGVGVQASWDPGEKQRGFRMSVTSARGQDGGGRTTLWNNAAAVTRPPGMGAMGMSSQSRMESEVAYGGLRILGLPSPLTPYSRVRWSGQGRELTIGTQWSLPTRSQQALPLMLELEAMRRESRTGPAVLAVLARMSIPF